MHDYLPFIPSIYKLILHQRPSKYNLVLIDGDGMIFSASLLKQGSDGGRLAAVTLRSLFPDNEPTKIYIFANLDGLSSAARQGSLIPEQRKLREFFQGFSDPCNPFCYFVDVGTGKEKADHKLNEVLEWHLRESGGACKSVLLGISHDNGYARTLQKLSEYHHKIKLLQGPPFEREIAKFIDEGIQKVVVPDLFESSKITNTAAAAATSPSGPVRSSSFAPQPATWANLITSNLASTDEFPPLSSSRNHISGNTPPPSPLLRKLHAVYTVPAKKVTFSNETFSKIRNLDPRPCNNYYLRNGDCWYGDTCTHSHTYKFNQEEIAALRAYVERIQCKKKDECTDKDCYYGHCPTQ